MPHYNDLEARLAELQTREHALKQLVVSTGWKDLKSICDGAITARREAAFSQLSNLKGVDECFSLARLGAEIAGMQFVLAIPLMLLKDLAADIARVIEEQRETENG